MKSLRTLGLGLAVLVAPSAALAGTITAQGNVVAITDRNAFGPIWGTGPFDGTPDTNLSLTAYAAQGLTFHTGSFATIFPGAQGAGDASAPYLRSDGPSYFPQPPGGNGVQQGNYNWFAGVARFSVTVTRFGLTASANGTQYLTVWNQGGAIIGQVVWTPSGDSAFVGVDTLGVPIGMIAYGNDDVRAGATYGIGGSTIMSDTWIWGNPCIDVVCNDGNPCTDDVCNIANGLCSYPAAAGAPSCNDGMSCTEGDVCSNGACAGTPVACDDGNGCTSESCVEGQGCVPVALPDGTGCDDGLACTDGETCTGGVCSGSGCDDGNPCTIDGCDQQGGCEPAVPAEAGAACDDDDVCTVRDSCDGAGQCASGAPLDCDDANECTLDGCQSLVGCVSVAAPEGTPCTAGVCAAGVCVPDGGEGGSDPGTGGAPGTGGEAPGTGGEGPGGGPGATTGSGSTTTTTTSATGGGTGGGDGTTTGGAGGAAAGGDEAGGDDGCGCEVVGAPAPRSSSLLTLLAVAVGAGLARRTRRDRR